MPTRKVTAGGVAGAISAIIVWMLNAYFLIEKPIPAEIAVAITTVLTFAVQYVVPDKQGA